MAFSRSWLKSLSLTDEQVSAIIEEHTSVTDGFKETLKKKDAELEETKKQSAKVPELQKEIEQLKGGEDWKSKYEKAVKDHDDYVKGIEAKTLQENTKAAYRKLLADERIKEDRIDVIMKHTDFSEMKLDKDGNLENLDGLKKTISEDWGMFQVTKHERKPSVSTPPEDNGGKGMSRAKELAQKFAQERYGVKPDAGKEKSE